MSVQPDITWEGRPVVVTGAGGFIGSHLVERLIELGADVTAFVRYNSRNDAGLIAGASAERSSLRIVSGDITEPETVRELVNGAEVVFHLAALVGIPYSYVHPTEVVAVNTTGTLNVLVAARDAGVQKLVIASTSEVYGTARYVPIDERHPKQPQSPYSASKIAADAVALSFHHAFELPVAIARPFNTYGPRQSDRAIIPTIISQALVKGEIEVGSTTPTRDFTFVLDTVAGFIRLAESPLAVGQEINLGSGQEISIGALAARIADLVGIEHRLAVSDSRKRPAGSEVQRLLADPTKAKELVGWQPQVSLTDGLGATIAWVERNLERYDAASYRI
jgi:NAD dependent epimerase/dehydratase